MDNIKDAYHDLQCSIVTADTFLSFFAATAIGSL
jgi:hypothetical protein